LPGSNNVRLAVTDIQGKVYSVVCSLSDTVIKLKTAVRTATSIDSNQQRLFFNGTLLEEYAGNKALTLSDFGVSDGVTILLIKQLFDFGDKDIKEVIFDLNWSYPAHGPDYLDGTCLIYAKQNTSELIDYSHKFAAGITHSGDVMDHNTRKGHHKITVKLQDIPPHQTQLFFILSAWNSPNIGSYPSPTVSMYDTARPTEQLCTFSISQASSHKAVIMCCLSRGNKWSVDQLGVFSSGNAGNYSSIHETIGELSCLQK